MTHRQGSTGDKARPAGEAASPAALVALVDFRPGDEIVYAAPGIGPAKGGLIVSLPGEHPGDVERIVADVRAMPRARRRKVVRSVTAAVRAVAGSAAVKDLHSGNDGGFLADLRILAALREIEGDKVLAAAGIARLARLSPERPSLLPEEG